MNSCPIKTSKEWKTLVDQVGEDLSWATWAYYGYNYPATLNNVSSLKRALSIKSPCSKNQYLKLAERVTKYNNKYGTAHSFTPVQVGQADLYDIDLKINYLPKKVVIKTVYQGDNSVLGNEYTKAFINNNPEVFISEGNQYIINGEVYGSYEDAINSSLDYDRPFAEKLFRNYEKDFIPADKDKVYELLALAKNQGISGVLNHIISNTKDPIIKIFAKAFLDNIDRAGFLQIKFDVARDRYGNYVQDASGSYGGGIININWKKVFFNATNLIHKNGLDSGYKSIIHELVHVYTLQALRNPQTSKEKEFKNKITKAYNTLKQDAAFKSDYGLSSVEEFISEIISNPEFRGTLNIYKAGFLAKIINYIAKLFGYTKDISMEESNRASIIHETVNTFLKDLPYLTPSKGKSIYYDKANNIKPGVSELFESNPKLADAVYEAVGFTNNNLQLFKNKLIDIIGEDKIKELYQNTDVQFNSFVIDDVELGTDKDLIITIKTDKGQRTAINLRLDGDYQKLKISEGSKTVRGIYAPLSEKKTAIDFLISEFKNLDEKEITPQQKQQAIEIYSKYLDTIFPNSKVKDIVYHGSHISNIEKFDFSKQRTSLTGYLPKGGYFTSEKAVANSYSDKKGKIYSAILNLKNPRIIQGNENYNDISRTLQKEAGVYKKQGITNKEITDALNNLNEQIVRNNDGVVLLKIKDSATSSEFTPIYGYGELSYNEDNENTYVVFEPEQIHILGNKQDIEGFKEFVNSNNVDISLLPDSNSNIKPGIAELFESNPELANQIYEALGFQGSISLESNLKNTGKTEKELTDYLKNKYPEIKLNISNNPIWEQSSDIVKNQEEYNKKVQYRLKATEILLSDKAKQVFNKGKKNKWSLDKILSELAIPKEQKQIILDLNDEDYSFANFDLRESIILALSSNYSYTVEINTAKTSRNLEDTPTVTTVYRDFDYEGELFTKRDELDFDGEYKEVYRRNGNQIKRAEFIEFAKKAELVRVASPTQYYLTLTVPGGTNYTENEISTPLITPSIKGHAQFSTNNGIGWFRSDDAAKYVENSKQKALQRAIDDPNYLPFDEDYLSNETTNIKTRRILELQSDLFQKGRDKSNLLNPFKVTYQEQKGKTVEQIEQEQINKSENQFLQLLNKDNNWVTFFIKSIIQDSAKKGYDKVLFPKGETAAKIEGHETLADEIKRVNFQIESIKNEEPPKLGEPFSDSMDYRDDSIKIATQEDIDRFESNKKTRIEIQEKRKSVLKSQGIEKLKPIEAFYEIKVGNILEKQFGKDNVKTITDEYGNQWREISINQSRDLDNILLQKNEANRIIGQANIKAMTVLVDAVNKKEDTIPHEYAHHYIAWFRNTPIVQEAIKRFGSEEALVQAIGEQVVKQKGEAYNWWKKFTNWILNLLSDKQLLQVLTDSFLNRQDLHDFTYNQPNTQQKQQAIEIYSKYLDTIFPESKVKNIVYHGSSEKREELDPSKQIRGRFGKGVSFASTPELVKQLIDNPVIHSAIINLKNPLTDIPDKRDEVQPAVEAGGHDGVQVGKIEYTVPTKEQIHILGSKKDIEGFKEFVNNNKELQHKESNNQNVNIIEDLLPAASNNPSVGNPLQNGTRFQAVIDSYIERSKALRDSIARLKVKRKESNDPVEKANLYKRISKLQKAINEIESTDPSNPGLIKKVSQISALENIIPYAEAQLKNVRDILKADKITIEDLKYSEKIVALWIKAGDFSGREHLFWTQSELEDSENNPVLQEALKQFSRLKIEADIIKSTLINPIRENIAKKSVEEQFGKKAIPDLHKAIRDVNWGTMQALDISEVNNPLVQAMHSYLKKANFKAFTEATTISETIDTLIKKIGKVNWDLFKQTFSNTDNRETGNLVYRFSQVFFDERSTILSNARASKNAKARAQAYKKLVKFNADKTIIFDVRKLFPGYWNTTFTQQEIDAHIKELKDTLGEYGYNKFYEKAKENIDKYILDLESQKQIIEDNNTVNGVLNKSAYDIELANWVRENSPAAEAEIYSMSSNDINNMTFTPSGTYSVKVPRRVINGKDTGYYDKKFETIESNEDLRNLYEILFDTINELKAVLPYEDTKWMQINSLPTVYKNILDQYGEDGMAAGLNPLMDALAESSRTSDLSTTDYRYRNLSTGDPDKHIQTSMMIDYNNKIKELVKLKIVEYKLENNSNPSMDQINEFKKDAANKIAQEKSFDLGKVTKMYALMALSYKHKAAIQHIMESLEYTIKNTPEIGVNPADAPLYDKNGNPIKLNGRLSNLSTMLDTFMDYYYGYKMDKPFGKTKSKIYTTEEKEKKDNLEEALELNEKKYSNKEITEAEYNSNKEVLTEMLEMLGGVRTWSKYGDMFLQYVQVKGMGWNIFAGITNMLYGFISNLIEASDGRNYDQESFWKAQSKVLRTVGGNKFTDEAIKIRSLMKKLDILKDSRYELYDSTSQSAFGKFKKKFKALNPYTPQTSTEFINQATVLVAMMIYNKVEVNGSEIPLYDCFDKNGELKEGIALPENFDLADFKIRVDKVIKLNHGNYDPDSPLNLKRQLLGRALSQFRTWSFQGFSERFMGEMYDYQLGMVRKGRYRSYVDFYKTMKDNDVGYIASTFYITKQLLRKASFGVYNTEFGEIQGLSEVDAANMRKNMTELVVLAMLTAVALLLKDLIDKDRKGPKYLAYFYLNQITRLSTDLMFYTSPSQFEKLTRNAMPAFSAVIDLEDAMAKSINYIVDNESDEIKTGVNAHKSKAFRAINKVVPNPYSGLGRVMDAAQTDYSTKPIK